MVNTMHIPSHGVFVLLYACATQLCFYLNMNRGSFYHQCVAPQHSPGPLSGHKRPLSGDKARPWRIMLV